MSLTFAQFEAAAPEALTALRALSKSVTLPSALTELVKVRASQINACAFCLKLHLAWARKAGVDEAKLDLLPVWREADVHDDREKAALAWTEALTVAPGDHHAVAQARALVDVRFTPDEVVQLTVAVAAINAWNRIAGPLALTA